ncbi:hypothetical protein DUNSADRAFT_14322 [Dunaliella salina]|uniref:C3H1-type domain-containing protein n=1 Tax=Dunaliella salina TaxID=3046 RepID=A0ABQ7G7K5_DUNSA|nr:hypothetical protein DUNSADRAFT_14322 [Dunaliella salina]|eukprot:KAF5830592.1 hypothetical protein DUNSADRAFT_14322 [Dunaliella salina]
MEQIEIQGQVVHRRSISRRLLFIDVAVTSTPEPCFMELVVKLDAIGSENAVRGVKDSVRLGDVVRAKGFLDQLGSCVVQALDVISKWCHSELGKEGIQFIVDEAAQKWCAARPQRVQQQQQQQLPASHHETSGDVGHVQHAAAGSTGLERPEPRAAAGAVGQVLASTSGAPTSAPPGAPTSTSTSTSMPGAHTFPLQEAFASVSASPPGAPMSTAKPAKPVCKFWQNSGRCAAGAACKFLHLSHAERAQTHQAYHQQR